MTESKCATSKNLGKDGWGLGGGVCRTKKGRIEIEGNREAGTTNKKGREGGIGVWGRD